MNIPLFSYLANLIVEMLSQGTPVVAKAAGKAATAAAVASAESDPKVQAVTAASVALLAAAKDFKAAVNDHPDAPEIIPAK